MFVLRRFSEKFRAKTKKLLFIFVDQEKAFDRVPRDVTRFDLRQKGVPEYLVDSVMSLQKDSNLSSQGTIKFIFCES